jgi:hypothetical protein
MRKFSVGAVAVVGSLMLGSWMGATAQASTVQTLDVGNTFNSRTPTDVGISVTSTDYANITGGYLLTVTGFSGTITFPGGSSDVAIGGDFLMHVTFDTTGNAVSGDLLVTAEPLSTFNLATFASSANLLGFGAISDSTTGAKLALTFEQQAVSSPAFDAQAVPVGSPVVVLLTVPSWPQNGGLQFDQAFSDIGASADVAAVAVPLPMAAWSGGAVMFGLLGLGKLAKRRLA